MSKQELELTKKPLEDENNTFITGRRTKPLVDVNSVLGIEKYVLADVVNSCFPKIKEDETKKEEI